MPRILGRVAIALLLMLGSRVDAQQVNVQTPHMRSSSSFYEHFNVGWGFRRGNTFFEFNSPAFPSFGGYDPNADARFRMAQRWGNGSFSFRFAAGQGSTRSLTMSAPSVTSMNGMPASFQDVTIRPFVTGLIPTVGGFQMLPIPNFNAPPPVVISPLAGKAEAIRSQLPNGRVPKRQHERATNTGDEPPVAPMFTSAIRHSTAEKGDVSVEEIRRQQSDEEATHQREIDRLCSEARIAEVAGQFGIARVRYQQAAARATGKQREKILAAAARLKSNGED